MRSQTMLHADSLESYMVPSIEQEFIIMIWMHKKLQTGLRNHLVL